MLIKSFFPPVSALGTSTNPCSDIYCGKTPESEIEVRNVANFIRRNKATIKAYLTVHSYSQLLLFPYSYSYNLAADHSELVKYLYTACMLLSQKTVFIRGPK